MQSQNPTTIIPRRHGSPADRELAALLSEVSRLLARFEIEYGMTTDGNSAKSGTPPFGYRKFFDAESMVERKKWAESLAGDTKKVVKDNLERAETLGANRKIALAPNPVVLDELHRDFPNFEEVTLLVQRRLTLSRCAHEKVCRLPPLLLAGPPGAGKTAYSKRLASLLGVECTEVDVSTMSASFSLSGLDTGYSTGRPGRVWDALNQGTGCITGLFLLDEIDKVSSDTKDSHLGFLYGLLERDSARRFQDAALLLPVDASHLMWVATCNGTDTLDAALLSRFEVIQIAQPDSSQMQAVVASVHRALMREADWSGAFDSTLDAEVVAALLDRSPRSIRRILEEAYANAASAGRRRVEARDIECRDSITDLVSHRVPFGFIDTRPQNVRQASSTERQK